MQKIYLITDYKNQFGTKYTAIPYRSGMDKEMLKEEFLNYGIEPLFFNASEILEKNHTIKGQLFFYTSSEDRQESYKSFLEDVILTIESMNGIPIPRFLYLRAHNNKVFMELLKKEWGIEVGDKLRSQCFGSYEELIQQEISLNFPVVVKRPEGFKSRGVYLAKNIKELKKIASRLSKTRHFKSELKDFIRTFIHKGFRMESHNRRKFIIQEFIPGLENDWKILIYGDKYYPLFRRNRKDDFRASGSGLLSYPKELPDGLLDFAEKAFSYFNVPNISLDIAFDGKDFHIMETQFLYFGTYTIEHSEFYFRKESGEWMIVQEKSVLEKEYVRSIVDYLKKNFLLK